MKNLQSILKSISNHKIEYFFTFLLIGFTGIPFFLDMDKYLSISFILVLIVALHYGKVKIYKEFVVLISLIAIGVVVQTIEFGEISPYTTIGTFIKFFFPYLVILLVGKNLPKIYVNILYILSIVSLIIFIPSLVPGIEEKYSSFFHKYNVEQVKYGFRGSLIFYTHVYGSFRNAGPFWEPGALGGLVTIALLFNIVIQKKLLEKKNIIFLITAITTLSTSAYIALFLVVLFYLYINKSKYKYRNVPKLYLLLLLLFLGLLAFTKFGFMKDKILDQIDHVRNPYRLYLNTNRFGSALVDINDIKKYPLWGRGRSEITKYDNFKYLLHIEKHRTNGITDQIVKFGCIFSIVFFYYIYKSINYFCRSENYNIKFSLYAFIVILVLSFSNLWLIKPVFIGLSYLHVNYPHNKLG